MFEFNLLVISKFVGCFDKNLELTKGFGMETQTQSMDRNTETQNENKTQNRVENRTENKVENSNFLSGLEELVARFIALVLTTAIFSVYVAGRNEPISLDATKMVLLLLLYWFGYEVVSFVFFMILRRFSSSRVVITESVSTTAENKEVK